jgi:hypothetical protein
MDPLAGAAVAIGRDEKTNLIESRLGCRQLSRLCVEVLAEGLPHAVDVRSV